MILVNGEPGDRVPAADRGLAYGDGVFRTLAVRRGRPQAWPSHFHKLQRDCAALGIACPDEAALREDMVRATPATGECAAKIIVTRGAGERGYAPPSGAAPTRIVMTGPLPQHPADYLTHGVTARWCTLRLAHQPALAGIKHLNRLENVLARGEWRDPGIAEGLMRDTADNVVCGTMSNLFIAEGDALVTPRLDRCGVEGVTRARILAAARREGVAAVEDDIPPERLLEAGAVLLVNSLIGVWQVTALGERRWPGEPVVQHVREWLDETGD